MDRKEVLETALKTVCEERKDQYGELENNFEDIAKLWTYWLDVKVSAEDVAIMMLLLKVARARTGKFHADNFVDMAGYAACAAEVWNGGKVTKEEETARKAEQDRLDAMSDDKLLNRWTRENWKPVKIKRFEPWEDEE